MVLTKKSPSKPASNQDPSNISPQPRVASGTLPPQAAHAPEFVPGEQKTSEASSDKETEQKTKKRTKAEEEADEKAQREQALDEEWWSGDEVFVPNLKDKDDLLNDQQD